MKISLNKVIIILFIVSVFSFSILSTGNLYAVGGDDSRMYYLYPFEYIKNFSFNVISNNNLGAYGGYNPVSFSIPIFLIIYVMKLLLPFWNTQAVMYGLIYSLGFLSFYLLLGLWDFRKNSFTFWSRIIGSLFYIFSVYLTKTVYSYQLSAVYLVIAVPLFLYFFTKGVLEKDARYVLLASLGYAIWSSTIWTMPWFFPVLLTLFPYFIYLFWKEKLSFIRALLLFVVSSLLFNFYWITHQIIHLFINTGEGSIVEYLTSKDLVQQNVDTITALVRLNDPINQMSSYIRTAWKEVHGISFFQSLGVFYLAVILATGAVIRKVDKKVAHIFFVVVIGLVIGMVFVTPNFGAWNLDLFLFCNQHVPFFTMFRNMYDKFSLAMAFMFAFSLFISLEIIDSVMKQKLKSILLVLLFGLTILRFDTVSFFRVQELAFSSDISGTLQTEFTDLTKAIKAMPTTARFIWYPLTMPNYIYVSDGLLKNHYYYGASILQPLTNKPDVAGYYGFGSSQQPNLKDIILGLLQEKKYDQIGEIWKKLNIGYVIVNKESIFGEAYNHLNELNFISLQTDEYLHTILGDKIQDFGDKYSLYRINDIYKGETVELVPETNEVHNQKETVSYVSASSGEYEVEIQNLSGAKKLLLREPYNRLWKVYLVGNNKKIDLNLISVPADTYGNVWELNKGLLDEKYASYVSINSDNTINMTLQIVFMPIYATKIGVVISLVSVVLAIGYIIFLTVKKRRI